MAQPQAPPMSRAHTVLPALSPTPYPDTLHPSPPSPLAGVPSATLRPCPLTPASTHPPHGRTHLPLSRRSSLAANPAAAAPATAAEAELAVVLKGGKPSKLKMLRTTMWPAGKKKTDDFTDLARTDSAFGSERSSASDAPSAMPSNAPDPTPLARRT
eukprot:4031784-Prymnesium_polylepis.1